MWIVGQDNEVLPIKDKLSTRNMEIDKIKIIDVRAKL